MQTEHTRNKLSPEAEKFLELILENHPLDEETVTLIIETSLNEDKKIKDVLIDKGYLNEDEMLQIIAASLNTEYSNLDNVDLYTGQLQLLPPMVIQKYNVIPLKVDFKNSTLTIGAKVKDCFNEKLREIILQITEFDKVIFVICSEEKIQNIIKDLQH